MPAAKYAFYRAMLLETLTDLPSLIMACIACATMLAAACAG